MKSFFFIFSLAITVPVHSQEAEIKAVIDRMFNALFSGDTATLRTCFTPEADLWTYYHDSQGREKTIREPLEGFLVAVAKIDGAGMDERLTGWQCLVDEGIASVWTPYEFYIYEKLNHCGVNSFQLIKHDGQWKISMISDTRRKQACLSQKQTSIHLDSLINQWHHAAAIADENTFFGFMTDKAIYIGTDATERWYRDELKTWSEKYFARETAWDFKPLSRNIQFSPGNELAWFDELLDTWMGTCRSTGIVQKIEGEWKLIYYHLSIAVPNEKIDGYRQLIGLE